MRIVLISDWFAEPMGYAENCLPRALASLGHEVHLVTSNTQPYFNSPMYTTTYAPFLGPGVVDCGVKALDGYTLHRLPHKLGRGRVAVRGLVRRLASLRPQIVQTFEVACSTTYWAALAQPLIGYRLFLESHVHASVFPPALRWGGLKERLDWLAYAMTLGRFVSSRSTKCYPVSTDAADVAVQFYGIESSKIEVCSLGVDTHLFRPPSDPAAQVERGRLRRELGLADADVVCIYTGRFSPDKGPLHLAQAVSRLVSEGAAIRGLFVGNGTPEEVAAIRRCAGCIVQPFVPVHQLPRFYWAADIGVWPKQESTSQLDAAACGLPLILSHRVAVVERITGNGLLYEEGNSEDLARTIGALTDPQMRRDMSVIGVEKVHRLYGWQRIAAERITAYRAALDGRPQSRSPEPALVRE